MPQPIVIIGSINMDLVIRASQMPEAGETLLGEDFQTIPGGKGANQAVAAARLGKSPVYMVGRVGDDAFGKTLRDGLKANGVNVGHVRISRGTSSGCAMIFVNPRGHNSIIVSPGANSKLSPADIQKARAIIRGAAVVVLQLEIPLDTVAYALRLCRQHGVYTILDPAPVPHRGLPKDLWNVDLLTPNEPEAEHLITPRASRSHRKNLSELQKISLRLHRRGPATVVMKLGARGALVCKGAAGSERVEPFKVSVVDTTAAGDAFTGALAIARSEGKSLMEGVRFANAAGAVACKAFGAQPSLPSRRSVDALMKTQRPSRSRKKI